MCASTRPDAVFEGVIKTYDVQSRVRNEMIDVTPLVRRFIEEESICDGVVMAFVPHTTAAVTINENADPDVGRDFLVGLEKISPVRAEYRHGEGNSDAHIKSSLIGVSELIAVEGGRPVLGTWQGLYFCEFDGPRRRKIQFKKL